MKKILIFSIAYIPFVGGAELAVKEITDRINDIQFDLITLRFNKNWPQFEKIGNVNVYRINTSKLFFPFSALLKARKLNKENQYDIIWSIMANRAGFSALFFKIFHPKIKFLLTLQEGDTLDYPEKQMGFFLAPLKPLFRAIFSRADFIQAISKYLGNWAMEMRAKNPIEIVPNGVDINKFKSQISNLKSNELRKKLKIEKNEKVLITTSRLVEKNAIGDIIETMKYLPINIKFLILGKGPLENKLKSQVLNFNLQNRIMFLGHIKSQEIPNYLAISDIFVRPSLSEGLGNSFLEAMAAGIPVIATPVGGIPDFLKDNETGLFCEINDPKSIAGKVMLLLSDSALAQKIKLNAKEMIAKNYDWKLIAGKMRNIFEKI
jgi:glycosyltransferase involved in cell wall biosynthesis